jgi:hypothetical protein
LTKKCFQPINQSVITKSVFQNFFIQHRCHSEASADNGVGTTIGKVEVKINLMYKCNVCNEHNSHLISRHAYENGVVIVTCAGCKNKHLIADNLNWFEDIKEKNVEEMLLKKGEIVLKVKAVPEFSIE